MRQTRLNPTKMELLFINKHPVILVLIITVDEVMLSLKELVCDLGVLLALAYMAGGNLVRGQITSGLASLIYNAGYHLYNLTWGGPRFYIREHLTKLACAHFFSSP